MSEKRKSIEIEATKILTLSSHMLLTGFEAKLTLLYLFQACKLMYSASVIDEGYGLKALTYGGLILLLPVPLL